MGPTEFLSPRGGRHRLEARQAAGTGQLRFPLLPWNCQHQTSGHHRADQKPLRSVKAGVGAEGKEAGEPGRWRAGTPPSRRGGRGSDTGSDASKVVAVFVQSLGCVQPFVTPWTAARQASLPFTISWIFLKLMSMESVMPSNHLLLCRPLLLLPSIFPSIRVTVIIGRADLRFKPGLAPRSGPLQPTEGPLPLESGYCSPHTQWGQPRGLRPSLTAPSTTSSFFPKPCRPPISPGIGPCSSSCPEHSSPNDAHTPCKMTRPLL